MEWRSVAQTRLFTGLLEGQSMLALGVAVFTARHDIAFGGFAAADDRHQMIHGPIARRKFSAAVMSKTGASFALPPLAGAQVARSLPLTANLLFGYFHQESGSVHHLYHRLRFRK